ncbi:S8 family peptidase [Aquabacter spiritensis]|uniref:Subtilase family protein n=1 Tax=Aquabacter spiritensis TaxID=933073 RepID=A0A4R3M5E1_9HYPH|nr:S8 family serine peptidase [Aquabacter spiritensis]TCT07489.1 subtilase family protein [Aquabacter spiritensis]
MVSRYIPSDPLFGQQWHLWNTGQDIYDLPQTDGAYRNDINVTPVWTDYTGAGVIVGVYDNGFQGDHPDYVANYLADKAYDFSKDRPGQTAGDHGTATLGLIVATQNTIGGVGVAFDADAIAYTWGSGNDFPRAVARMLLDGVAVSSNSWGPNTTFGGPTFDPVQQSNMNTALLNLAQLGRDGLGTVSVFAAGNERTQHYNSTFMETSNSPFAITVAAANADGTVSAYSNPGPSVLVAAPGSGYNPNGTVSELPSIVTTDLLGTNGYNTLPDGDYTNVLDRTVIDPATGKIKAGGFNGTSAATPIVSGVAALILEANSALGYRDVQEILAYSAKTPDGVATWSANGATDWNGGGHLYSNDLGFGHVDALAAVRLAETWQKQSTYDNVAQAERIFAAAQTIVAAGQTQRFTAQFTEVIRVQHAVVSVSLDMGMGADTLASVTMTLTGPNGQTSSVFLDPAAYIPVFRDPVTQSYTSGLPQKITYSFDTVHDWGELSNSGAWTLTVTNASTGQDLTMGAELALLGDTATGGQTFVYTDDYARLGAAEGDRTILGATSVGPHTLNAAAVTFDTTIDLVQHTAEIAGVATTIGGSLQFASLITGDGNDSLTGDAYATTFFSGRGINTVDGGAGTDTLWVLKGVSDYVQAGYGDKTVLFSGASQDTLAGIETLKFADGSLTLGTDPLVNEVFYAAHNADVFAAGVDIDTHYATYGWMEGRDPNAWFSTTAYLANHADVAAAGINPLDHYNQTGWLAGYDPSAQFDTSLYLHFNADVAAAGLDPLMHYLQYGIVEGRQAYEVVDSAHITDSFDATFYLLANADVASAGVDAVTHYDQYGWKEGRNPDAFFSSTFYLAYNPDVAAAGINPLTHYDQYGWREGRNPSADFDTNAYLEAYADVRAADIDPLQHYLQYGLLEGRAAFAWDLA